MTLITIFLGALLIGLVALYFHLNRKHGHLETTGLPMLPPFLCFGSPPFAVHKMRMYEWYQEKFRQLGNTFARYNGYQPSIVTIDPDFIREVTVKQFENFTDVVSTPVSPEQVFGKLLFLALSLQTNNYSRIYRLLVETLGELCEK